MKHIGLIGSGKHGSRYASHIVHDIPGLSLAGICRRSEAGREQARLLRSRYFSDWRELIRCPDVDAIVAVVPPFLNVEIARLCAEKGKPLLVEKPLARNSQEAQELVRLMSEADCLLTVGQTLRYNPVVQALKEQLPALGTLHSFTVNQRIEPSTLDWHDDPEIAGAGVIIHTAVHIFDALRLITGLRAVRVFAALRSIHTTRLEDLVIALVELENGVVGTLDVSKVGNARSGRYEFICQNGQLHGDQIFGFTKKIEKSVIVSQQHFQQVPTILRLLQDWTQYIGGVSKNPVAGEDGLYAVRVCDACLQSAAEKRWVDIAEM